jgi:hypothetical protein
MRLKGRINFVKSSGYYTYSHVQNLKRKKKSKFCTQGTVTFLLCFLEQIVIISLCSINRMGLGAFAKFRKATVNLVMCVRPFVCTRLTFWHRSFTFKF